IVTTRSVTFVVRRATSFVKSGDQERSRHEYESSALPSLVSWNSGSPALRRKMLLSRTATVHGFWPRGPRGRLRTSRGIGPLSRAGPASAGDSSLDSRLNAHVF